MILFNKVNSVNLLFTKTTIFFLVTILLKYAFLNVYLKKFNFYFGAVSFES